MRNRRTAIVVDDHAVFREGLRALLAHVKGLKVIGEASRADEALRQCMALRPDLVTLDISLADASGLQVLSDLRQALPDAAILMVSMHEAALYARRALQAGASGYVGKQDDSEVLLTAVRTVLEGKLFVSSSVADVLLEGLAGRACKDAATRLGQLSAREREILRCLGLGETVAELAQRLHISPKTVEAHRAHIKEKLGVASAHELVIRAVNWVRDGLLDS